MPWTEVFRQDQNIISIQSDRIQANNRRLVSEFRIPKRRVRVQYGGVNTQTIQQFNMAIANFIAASGTLIFIAKIIKHNQQQITLPLI